MLVELWKPVVGYEGYYEISNLGNVKSLRFGKILKPSNSGGYAHIALVSDGTPRYFLVHRLVATSFIPNPHNKLEVNHIDGDKKNNCVDNLEWVNRSENQSHAVHSGLQAHGEGSVNHKLTKDMVEEIRSLYVPNKRGCGCKSLAKRYGVNAGTIYNIVTNKYWRWI